MANRAYLYSLSNRPTSYADRPETITGLSEWPYAIPFTYRVLLSGDPQICASLLSDGFDEEPADAKSQLHAISGDFETGFARLRKFIAILRPLVVNRCRVLTANLDETLAFLESHRDRYLLLETVELDMMMTSAEDELWGRVHWESVECRRAGAAIDALPDNVVEAGARLMQAAQERTDPPFDVLHGLRFDDDHDNVRGGLTEYPLGLAWTEVLFFGLWNRAEFEDNAERRNEID